MDAIVLVAALIVAAMYVTVGACLFGRLVIRIRARRARPEATPHGDNGARATSAGGHTGR
jgi:hypothetical protein